MSTFNSESFRNPNQPKSVKRGIYILPSLFTTCNLAAGFLSIIWSINGNFTAASWAILVAILLDIVDGRVARWTRTESQFGVEYDSLADLMSFGAAPAVLMYLMVLYTLGTPGIAIALFFVISGALRLARFNTKTQGGEVPPHFTGLPIPAAAALLASFALSYELFEEGKEITAKTIPLLMQRMPFFFHAIAPTMVLISILMISNVPYVSFKRLKLSKPKSLQLLILIVIGFLLVIAYPQNTIFILFLLYLLTGITEYLIRFWRIRRSLIGSIKARKLAKNSEQQRNSGTSPLA